MVSKLVNSLVEIIQISYASEKSQETKDEFYVFITSVFSSQH